ncbi:hypothetical protein OROHE_024297 [Orobanche hederae]
MSQPIPVDILSDSDSGSGDDRRNNLRNDAIDLTTPPPFPQSKKKQRIDSISNPSNSTVFIIDDGPTPCKKTSTSTPSFIAETPFSGASIVKCSTRKCSISGESLATEQLVVADTPMSELLKYEVSLTKHDAGVSNSNYASLMSNHNSAEIHEPIFVESDTEFENVDVFGAMELDGSAFAATLTDESEFKSRHIEPSSSLGTSVQLQKNPWQNPVTMHIIEGYSSPGALEDSISVACDESDDTEDKASNIEPMVTNQQNNSGCCMREKKKADETMKPKRTSKEERLRLMEERKKRKEVFPLKTAYRLQEKLLKAASKAEAAELRKSKKEMQKWEKGKYAVKSIVAEIDKKVVELGSIGVPQLVSVFLSLGYLLTRFAEKGLSYRITSNPVERSIVWNMVVPNEVSTCVVYSSTKMIASERIEISYVLIIYEAEEFCNLVNNESLMDHIQSVQNRYPHHTICCLTNRLMAYINKRGTGTVQEPCKQHWLEAACCRGVHSRQCVDEAEVAEHVVGLTCSLASCQFRKKLTRLSVNANGAVIPKDCAEKNLIKKDLWLKALVAIPKVQPRCAIAVWKKYPTMKSLLRVYMDPAKTVHEKEFLLKDLITEGLLGDDRRLGEVCSKRIYRILMAQCGNIKTDDVENGADFFSRQST